MNHLDRSPETKTKPNKVISIPVDFAGSGDHNNITDKRSAAGPAAAAVKIQKVLRGFLVRKNARIVGAIEAEAAAIGREIRSKIRLDSKERLRYSELLMSLLLRLDSVRGVRDYRKRVVKHVISLQELVDSIPDSVQGGQCVVWEGKV